MRKIALVVFFLSILLSCRDKVICPAFQSTYILDDSAREAYFSYVWALDKETRQTYLASLNGGVSTEDSSYVDSSVDGDDLLVSDDTSVISAVSKVNYYEYVEDKVVPWRVPKRTKYGITKKTPFWLQGYRRRTAPMEDILTPPKPKIEEDTSLLALDSASTGSADSTALALEPTDTIQIRYLYGFDPKDKHNVEMEYYIKYFGKYLVDTVTIKADTTSVMDELEVENKTKLGQLIQKFFDLFKFGKKDESDTLDTGVESDTVEYDEDDDPDWFDRDEEEVTNTEDE